MYDELLAELRMHHCDAKENDTQEVCEECAYDVIIADKSVPSGIASVCVCGLMHRAADAIEELSKKYLASEVDNTNLTGWLAEEHAKHLWIPVTERLPEKDGKYLTVSTINTIPPQPWIEICWFAKNLRKVDKYDFPKKKAGFYKSSSEYGYYEVSGVIHWMALPEPPEPPNIMFYPQVDGITPQVIRPPKDGADMRNLQSDSGNANNSEVEEGELCR